MPAYYNEIDPNAAEWIRQLIKAGLVAPGEVDERDVLDVRPSDLKGFTQVHFFAGIATWSYALRLAGWPDERPVWTASLPCQPHSAAGKGAGFADERHLWPQFFHLVEECRPVVLLGEQVSSKGGLSWLDLVQTDLEGAGYAVGAVDTSASSFGAPHIRQRLYWVADTDASGSERWAAPTGCEAGTRAGATGGIAAHLLADTIRDERRQECAESGRGGGGGGGGGGAEGLEQRPLHGGAGYSGGVADAEDPHGRSGERGTQAGVGPHPERRLGPAGGAVGSMGDSARDDERGPSISAVRGKGEPDRGSGVPGPTNGFWAGADWIYCRDEKYRPIKSGIAPLASLITGRVVKLRGLGNSIVAVAAQGFIEAYLEARGER